MATKNGLRITLLIISLATGMVFSSQAQVADSILYKESIAVTARPSKDSITLRWAPLRLPVWQDGLTLGYIIERYVITRNGAVLSEPEKTVLQPSPLRPLPENAWEPIVVKNKYAAIAAQAMFGDRFEVDLSQTDVFSIVNKVRENEQRFAFALFSADMSPEVAKASALWFTDKNVRNGEKYLYRISIASTGGSAIPDASRRGSIFTSPDDAYTMPKPQNLQADFKDNLVSLRWDRTAINHYTAYVVERSTDGKVYTPISDTPLITVSPTDKEETRYEYAMDSIPDMNHTYYYRIKGITPFGEMSSASDVVSGKGNITVKEVPHITSGENIENKAVRLTWDFPKESNAAISGFMIERSAKPRENFKVVSHTIIPPNDRVFEDSSPQQTNYYRVIAQGVNGDAYPSPLHFVPLVDSIPPVAPVGLKASIDKQGSVELSWQPNQENDMFGYRIYRANTQSEELAQITSEPVKPAAYQDRVNVNTLNESVYYSVMAIDINQNHSGLSELLKVALPDIIKPQPPVLLPVKSNDNGVVLSWQRSSSDDVVQYDVYRRLAERNEWQRIKVLPVLDTDSVYYYTDETAAAGKTNNYTVTAIDEAGLESDPASPVSAGKIDNKLQAAVQWEPLVIDREKNKVVLNWQYDLPGVRLYRIYKSEDDNPDMLYRSLPEGEKKFSDTVIPGKQYRYRIMAVFEGGKMSALSKEITLTY